MSEIMEIGKEYKFFLKNGFFFQGKVISKDELFIKIIDRKIGEKIISLSEISEINLGNEQ